MATLEQYIETQLSTYAKELETIGDVDAYRKGFVGALRLIKSQFLHAYKEGAIEVPISNGQIKH